MAKAVNDNKGFFKYSNRKRKAKDNVDLLLNDGGRTLVSEETEKAELLNVFFSLVFTAIPGQYQMFTWVSLTHKSRIKEYWKEGFPLLKKDGF